MATKRRGGEDVKEKAKKGRMDRSSSSEDDNDSPLVIKCKTKFKKRLVERALEKEEDRESEDDEDEDPTVRYFVKYSVEKDLFLVGDVEVVVNESEKLLRCSTCHYVTKCGLRTGRAKCRRPSDNKVESEVRRLEFAIRNHIIGQHLGGFPCMECKPVRVNHQSLSSHQKHMRDVHNEQRKEIDAKIEEDREVMGDSDVWPDGTRKMAKVWKCAYPKCDKRFYQVKKLKSHEENVHGGVKTGVSQNVEEGEEGAEGRVGHRRRNFHQFICK